MWQRHKITHKKQHSLRFLGPFFALVFPTATEKIEWSNTSWKFLTGVAGQVSSGSSNFVSIVRNNDIYSSGS